MPKKTFNEKLAFAGDLPKVEKLSPGLSEKYKVSTMVIAAPMEYDALMKKVPAGKVTTIDRMMDHLAKKHGADRACPMTAGIFVNVSAKASEERGGKNETPWWRVLKKDGVLNEKFPGGIERQKIQLEAEGHKVIQKGKRYFVDGYEEKMFKLK